MQMQDQVFLEGGNLRGRDRWNLDTRNAELRTVWRKGPRVYVVLNRVRCVKCGMYEGLLRKM